jgi:large repetitive protein
VAADYTNNQSETNEGNNASAFIGVGVPNLVVSALSTPNTDASWGQTIELNWTVKNDSKQSANINWVDGIYLSKDDVLDSSDTLLGTLSAASNIPLAAGASYNATQSVNIPSSATDKPFVIVAADYTNNQVESDNNDNTRAINPIAVPDLKVTALTTPNTDASWGQTIELNWTVKNDSKQSANINWVDGIYLSKDDVLDSSDTLLGTLSAASNIPLAAGASYNATQSVNIPSSATDKSYVLLVADYNNNQVESDNANNTGAINPLASPDLVVSAKDLPGFKPGDTIPISWSVTNQGTQRANINWVDGIYLSKDAALDSSDILLGTLSAASNIPLAAGASYSATRSVNIPSSATDQPFVLVVTDYNNNQPETNEGNNAR